MLYYFTLGDTAQRKTAQCYYTYIPPEILYCRKKYMNENDTKMMLKNIQISKNFK